MSVDHSSKPKRFSFSNNIFFFLFAGMALAQLCLWAHRGLFACLFALQRSLSFQSLQACFSWWVFIYIIYIYICVCIHGMYIYIYLHM